MNTHALRQIREDCLSVVQGQEQLLAPLKGSHVLVAGGTGFVGSWLAEVLSCLNDEFSFGTHVTLLARSTDDFRASFPHLGLRRDFSFIKSDIRYAFEAPKDVSWVIHAASNPNNQFHSTNPVETMDVIANGTSAMIRAIERSSSFRQMLYISSGLIYGAQPWDLERMPESFSGSPHCGSVSSAYAEAKRFAESFCAAARSQQRLPIVMARPFAFMGPYQSLETPWAINNFIRDSLTSNTIRVQGDGQTVRSYLYGSDMAFWLLRILVAGTSGQAYNVGSPEGVTLENLAVMISNQFSVKPEITLRAAGSNAMQKTRFVPDVSLAIRSLGLSVKTPLEKAIARTLEWNRGK